MNNRLGAGAIYLDPRAFSPGHSEFTTRLIETASVSNHDDRPQRLSRHVKFTFRTGTKALSCATKVASVITAWSREVLQISAPCTRAVAEN